MTNAVIHTGGTDSPFPRHLYLNSNADSDRPDVTCPSQRPLFLPRLLSHARLTATIEPAIIVYIIL